MACTLPARRWSSSGAAAPARRGGACRCRGAEAPSRGPPTPRAHAARASSGVVPMASGWRWGGRGGRGAARHGALARAHRELSAATPVSHVQQAVRHQLGPADLVRGGIALPSARRLAQLLAVKRPLAPELVERQRPGGQVILLAPRVRLVRLEAATRVQEQRLLRQNRSPLDADLNGGLAHVEDGQQLVTRGQVLELQGQGVGAGTAVQPVSERRLRPLALLVAAPRPFFRFAHLN